MDRLSAHSNNQLDWYLITNFAPGILTRAVSLEIPVLSCLKWYNNRIDKWLETRIFGEKHIMYKSKLRGNAHYKFS